MTTQLVEDSEPVYETMHSCPYCGTEAVAISTRGTEKSRVLWCADGHVVVMLGTRWKKVFDFHNDEEVFAI